MTARGYRGCDGRRCVVKNATRGRLSEGNLAGDDLWCRSRGRGQVWAVTSVVSGRCLTVPTHERVRMSCGVREALGSA
jgi:hypothetical protein